MKAEEKRLLYVFFKTAADYLGGYKVDGAEPVFSDDGDAVRESAPLQKTVSLKNSFSRKRYEGSIAGKGDVSSQNETGAVNKDLEKLYAQIRSCAGCRLCETRKNAVPGEGPVQFSNPLGTIDVMVIGEGPGADEDTQGRPFVGKAGQLLDKMLAAIGLFRKDNWYITNIVKCRPPNNRDPLPDENAACKRFLQTQIQLIKPKAILAVGRIAAQNMLETSEGITRLHGKLLDYNGILFMATYHPSALLRNADLKRPAWEDLKLFRSKLAELKNT